MSDQRFHVLIANSRVFTSQTSHLKPGERHRVAGCNPLFHLAALLVRPVLIVHIRSRKRVQITSPVADNCRQQVIVSRFVAGGLYLRRLRTGSEAFESQGELVVLIAGRRLSVSLRWVLIRISGPLGMGGGCYSGEPRGTLYAISSEKDQLRVRDGCGENASQVKYGSERHLSNANSRNLPARS